MKKTLAMLAAAFVLAQPAAFADSVWTATESGDKYTLEYPVYENDDPDIKEAINADIYTRASECADAAPSFSTSKFHYKLISETEDYLSFTFISYALPEGAIHGMHYKAGVVYDKRTGQRIPLSRFVHVTVEDLVCLQADGEHFLSSNGRVLPPSSILGLPKRVPEDYMITDDGRLLVIFQPYEIACYADGAPSIDVTSLLRRAS